MKLQHYTVRDYFNHAIVDIDKCYHFILDIVDGFIIYDYTTDGNKVFAVADKDGNSIFYCKDKFQDKLIYDRRNGTYVISDNLTFTEKVYCDYYSGIGYKYSFVKVYGATYHLNLFKDKQQLVEPEIDFKLSKFLKYTFGLEFETATGIIPEAICFRDGLIPLRDGSISGNEYSTIVLQGNYGLNLLNQQIDTLKDYTYFDKNCSLHIHLGGFKLSPEYIYNVYKICYFLQYELRKILPLHTFKTSIYKGTGKDYCKELPDINSFETLYQYMVGLPFFGDFNQPHPNDLTHEHKWNIDTRYFFVNFINALCYRGGKTIEFRFLRPTYNLNKIIFWMYIFNAILICAEHGIVDNFKDLIYNVYPEDVAKDLMRNIIKCQICTEIQNRISDYIGERTDIEDRIFNTTELI